MAGIFDQLTARDSDEALSEMPLDTTDEVIEAPDRTPRRIREATQELLKYGLLEERSKPNLYRIVTTHAEEVKHILEPLDLTLGLDDVRGLAFVLVVAREFDKEPEVEADDWSHPLLRRQRLTLEQSLLVAILRQHFVVYEQEAGVGAGEAWVTLDDLLPQLQVYLGDPGSDAQERNRLLTLLDQLKGHGIVSGVDAHDRVVIRPIIAHLANSESLRALLQALRNAAGQDANPLPDEDAS